MPLLSTGLIIAGAYADKVRRTLFAQLKDKIKNNEITPQEVARAAGELNRVLYHILVEKLKTEKGDVVRARIEYEVEDGSVKWKYDTLRLEVFRRIPDDEVAAKVREVVSRIEEILSKAVQYRVEKAVETKIGDIIYWVKLGDRKVGAVIATPLDGAAIVRGAVLDPSPIIIDRARIEFEGKTLDEVIEQQVIELLRIGRHVETKEAEEVLKDIEAIIEAEAKARGQEIEKIEAWGREEQ